jgi:hypothetical protein
VSPVDSVFGRQITAVPAPAALTSQDTGVHRGSDGVDNRTFAETSPASAALTLNKSTSRFRRERWETGIFGPTFERNLVPTDRGFEDFITDPGALLISVT